MNASSWRRELFSLLCGACLGYLLCRSLISGTQIANVSPNPPVSNPLPSSSSPEKKYNALVDARVRELQLQSVMRSCLGFKCFDEKMQNVDRVGILSPPMGLGDVLMEFLHQVDVGDASVVYDTNVPPYGYGKNHGWSRIIRIVRPAIPHAYDILNRHAVLSEKLMDQQVRQLVRWHCRLSHVAAHTKMLTVFETDLLERPKVELEKIISFIGGTMNLRDKGDIKTEINRIGGRILQLSVPLENIPGTYVEAGMRAISDEMASTQDLSAWPCRFFRDLDPHLPLKSDLFTPNCSEKFVKCTIHYDLRGG